MKTLESGNDKVATICDALRRETLEPAKEEAKKIEIAAKEEAEKIIRKAESEAARIIKQGKEELEQERQVFQSSLEQSGKQAVEALRQDVEKKLFSSQLGEWLSKQTAEPKAVSKLIDAVVSALKKEGISADLSAFIPQTVTPEEVNSELGASVLKALSGEGVQVGSFSGGAQVRLDGKKITIDITDQALKEMLGAYVRKDFRDILFSEKKKG